jgi:GNAT superfamily N-acetyltransferase
VGIAGIRPAGWREFELTRCYVRPDAQGAGVGRRLVLDALRWAVRRGADRLVLDTLPAAMPAATGLYKSLGVQVTARRAVTGVPVPVETMTLDVRRSTPTERTVRGSA